MRTTRDKRGEPQSKPEIKARPPRVTQAGQGHWMEILAPLLKVPFKAKWCLIRTFPSRVSATSAQKNLTQRRVNIPEPDHNWSFSARDNELYAIYRGPYMKRKK